MMRRVSELKARLIEPIYELFAALEVDSVDFEIGEAPWHGYWVRLRLIDDVIRVVSLGEGETYGEYVVHLGVDQRFPNEFLLDMPLRDLAAIVETLSAIEEGNKYGAPGARVMSGKLVPEEDREEEEVSSE